jgi:hypothetical protein
MTNGTQASPLEIRRSKRAGAGWRELQLTLESALNSRAGAKTSRAVPSRRCCQPCPSLRPGWNPRWNSALMTRRDECLLCCLRASAADESSAGLGLRCAMLSCVGRCELVESWIDRC